MSEGDGQVMTFTPKGINTAIVTPFTDADTFEAAVFLM
jgi:hypothetical protein